MSENATIVARPERGVRVSAVVRGHRVETDQPQSGGGEDSAVMPLELLGVALATCSALYAHQFCAAREIDDDGLRVEVEMTTAKAPRRVSRFELRVHLPEALPTHYEEAIERAIRNCPAMNTLMLPTEVALQLERTEPALTAG